MCVSREKVHHRYININKGHKKDCDPQLTFIVSNKCKLEENKTIFMKKNKEKRQAYKTGF